MAYAITDDTTPTVLGDLVMYSGTFTDGGTEVDYSNLLSTVYACGGHLTSLVSTGVLINNNPVGYPVIGTATALTVGTVDARLHLAAGQTVYQGDLKAGIITSITNATTITMGGGTLIPLLHAQPLQVMGANKPSVTLISTSLDASVDETNKLIIFESGNRAADSTTSAEDGRWWIIGKR